jgi:ABC-type glycerol-3-phosphate transport system substrate-binding protein
MRSHLLAIVLAAALAALMGGCGGGDDDAGGSVNGRGEIVIKCASCQTSPVDPGLQVANEITERFNRKFKGKYRVEIVKSQWASSDNGSGDRVQHDQRLALANDLPDLFVLNPGELRNLYKTGKLMDFTASLDKDPAWKDAFLPDAFDAVSADGQTYAVPHTRDAIGIYFNKAMFRDAGVGEFPTTWAEFESACEKIKATGKTCFAMDGDWVTLLMWANLIGTQPGGKAFLDGGIREGDYSAVPEVVKATDTLKSWHDRGYINEDAFSGEYQNAATAFISGQAAMIANGPWMVGSDIKTKNAVKGLYDDIGYAASPGWTPDAPGILVISAEGSWASGTQDEAKQEAVAEFIKFFTAEHDNQLLQIAKQGAYTATKFEATKADRKQLEPLAEALVAKSATIETQYPHAFFNGPAPFESTWKNLWPAYVKGEYDTKEFLSRLASDSQSTTG